MTPKALILTAGRGTRLATWTAKQLGCCPKPLVPILGVPLLRRILARLRGVGITTCGINVHHLPQKFTAEQTSLPGLSTRHFLEPTLLGTGGALIHAARCWPADPLLLWNGDILTEFSLTALQRTHRERGAWMTLLTQQRPSAAQLLVDTDSSPDSSADDLADSWTDGWFCGIQSPARGGRRQPRPARRTFPIAYSGVALLAPAIYEHLPFAPHESQETAFDLIDALLTLLPARAPIAVHRQEAANFWGSNGTPKQLAELETELAKRPDLLAACTP